MKNLDEYRLKLEEYANNCDNKRQGHSHIITEDIIYNEYTAQLLESILLNENNVFDAMGDCDLKNYEKWLDDGLL